jgi:tRNA-2-methylthio-N6-dimethylallyladenosine synthase
MKPKYLIETFGCQMNELDSEKISGVLDHAGYEEADGPESADVIVLNTCSVRDKAVEKVYARLGEFRRLKRERPDLRVCVAGCMAQLEPGRILARAPYVDVVAGPQKGLLLPGLIERARGSGGSVIARRGDPPAAAAETPHIRRRSTYSAWVTISEGCSRRCSFCVVPLARGPERPRPSARILEEVRALADEGYVEIVLLGQTVNSYRDREAGVGFARLLREAAAVPGIRRIRFTSPHPGDFTDELLETMVSCPAVCNQIHLPVQSGSTRVLRAMRRGYTREQYLDIIRRIRAAARPIAVSTDLIVGFPGETEGDFEDTLTLLDEVQYDSAFSFKYSPRPDTAALALEDDVPDEEKGRRLTLLQERQRHIQSARNSRYVGRIVEVLVEGKARSRMALAGRSSDNRIVNFDGPETPPGTFAEVEITGFGPNSLKGVRVGQPRDARRARPPGMEGK